MGIGAWEPVTQEKLVIATPHTGLVTYEWATQFKVLMPPIPFNIISNRGLPIDRARCELVEQAIRLNATHLFFLDSDVILPGDALYRLYNHQLPIVSALYGSKHEFCGVWIMASESGEGRYVPVQKEILNQNPLFSHPQIVIGMGACLIQTQVFSRIKEPWFYWTHGREKGGISEDFYFCEKIRDKIPIHVDTTIKCKHVDYSSLEWDGTRQRLVL